jgi:GxxExxY protein
MDTDAHGLETNLTLGNEHLAQCINYLKASGLRVALLINFQRPKVEWKRVLLDP